MSQEPDKPTDTVASVLTHDLKARWYVWCSDHGRTSSEMIRSFIVGVLEGSTSEPKPEPETKDQPSPIVIEKVVIAQEPQGDKVNANLILLEAEIKQAEEFLSKKGWISASMKGQVTKIGRGLALSKELAERMRKIMFAPRPANEMPH